MKTLSRKHRLVCDKVMANQDIVHSRAWFSFLFQNAASFLQQSKYSQSDVSGYQVLQKALENAEMHRAGSHPSASSCQVMGIDVIHVRKAVYPQSTRIASKVGKLEEACF